MWPKADSSAVAALPACGRCAEHQHSITFGHPPPLGLVLSGHLMCSLDICHTVVACGSPGADADAVSAMRHVADMLGDCERRRTSSTWTRREASFLSAGATHQSTPSPQPCSSMPQR